MKNLQSIKAEIKRILVKCFPRWRSSEEVEHDINRIIQYLKVFGFFLSFPLIFIMVFQLLMILTPSLQNGMAGLMSGRMNDSISVNRNEDPFKSLKTAENRIKNLERTFARYKNWQPYLVVNTTKNEFTLYDKGKVVRRGVCSTGSYVLLDAGDQKKWKFETPKGLFRVQGKTESPVWRKPDWAFVEEGLPVPPSYSHLRYEYGVLGDYALSIGNGYLIHGTLYKRLLGMPVTHGCIRMDDEDLKAVFYTLNIGSKVYIY